MKQRTGWKIVAIIKGENLKIDIKDNSLQVLTSADGETCICKKVKQKYWVMEDEQ